MTELEEEERDKPRKMREEVITSLKSSLEEPERNSPEIQEALEKFAEKLNHTPINDLSSVKQAAENFILEKRYKRKRLYWKLPTQNWVDRWLARNRQALDEIWNKMTHTTNDGRRIEPNYFDGKAIYRIQFSPTLWTSLSEEQKTLAQQNGHGELNLRMGNTIRNLKKTSPSVTLFSTTGYLKILFSREALNGSGGNRITIPASSQ